MYYWLATRILRLVRKFIRTEARQENGVLIGSVGAFVPLICAGVAAMFGVFALLAIRDPDPDDRVAGYIVGIIAASVLLLAVHWWTLRISIDGNQLTSRSWIRDRGVIYLDQPFGVFAEEDDRYIRVTQNYRTIRISWFVHGYQEMSDLVLRKSRAF